MSQRSLRIQNIEISDESKCFIIAEIGHNHQGNIETAKKMIEVAADCGVSAVKLQKRSNKTLFTRSYYDRAYESENSFGKTYGEHREFLEFDLGQYRELQAFSSKLGLVFFATAFDFESADFLQSIDVPAYKLASGDLKNIPLMKYLAKFGKPLILSTGGGTTEDVDRAVKVLSDTNTPFSILQCTAGYPPEWNEVNLRVISDFRERYASPVIGFSSHDNGIAMSVAAYALGARVIEKHFTLNRTMRGTDHAFSLEPQGMRKLVRDLDRLHLAMGDGVKRQFESESGPLEKMGKKMVAAKNLEFGHVLCAEDVAFKSPGDGLAPWMIDEIMGRRARREIATDENLTTDIFE